MGKNLGNLVAMALIALSCVHALAQEGGTERLSPADQSDSNSSGTAASDSPATREIFAMLQQLNEGLARRNVNGIMELFAVSPEALVIGSKAGKIARGTDELRELFRTIVSAETNTRFDWKSYTVHSEGDVAWLFALADLVHESPEQTSRVPYRMTGLFLRQNGRWKWVQYHGSEPIGN
jgi:ketosteroid isomerase-like protein